jgi:hypothetical protein
MVHSQWAFLDIQSAAGAVGDRRCAITAAADALWW